MSEQRTPTIDEWGQCRPGSSSRHNRGRCSTSHRPGCPGYVLVQEKPLRAERCVECGVFVTDEEATSIAAQLVGENIATRTPCSAGCPGYLLVSPIKAEKCDDCGRFESDEDANVHYLTGLARKADLADGWRICVESALGVEPAPHHTPAWAREVVLAARELGNRRGRRRLEGERRAITRKIKVGSAFRVYATVGLYADGTPGELFLAADREGSTISGLLDAVAVLTSMALQHGVPLAAIAEKLRHTRFEPDGPTGDPGQPLATSPLDAVFGWLARRFTGEGEGEEV